MSKSTRWDTDPWLEELLHPAHLKPEDPPDFVDPTTYLAFGESALTDDNDLGHAAEVWTEATTDEEKHNAMKRMVECYQNVRKLTWAIDRRLSLLQRNHSTYAEWRQHGYPHHPISIETSDWVWARMNTEPEANVSIDMTTDCVDIILDSCKRYREVYRDLDLEFTSYGQNKNDPEEVKAIFKTMYLKYKELSLKGANARMYVRQLYQTGKATQLQLEKANKGSSSVPTQLATVDEAKED